MQRVKVNGIKVESKYLCCKKRRHPSNYSSKKKLKCQATHTCSGVDPSRIIFRRFIHKGNDEHTSCSVFDGEPLLCPWLRYTCNLMATLQALKQREWILVGLDHPTFRSRGGDVATSPPLPITSNFFTYGN